MDVLRISNVRSVPCLTTDPTMTAEHPSEISEMNMDFIKVELKAEEQDNANKTEEVTNSTCIKSSHRRQGPKVILMPQSSHNLAIVADLYTLLEDFRTRARSSRSLLCCQPAGCQSVLMCPLCGDNFVGKADRLLKLCKHYESVHPSDALKLIMDDLNRYNKLIGHMRKALQFDEWFVDVNYDPGQRTKSFECRECRKQQK